MGLQQTFGHVAQGPGIGGLQKAPHLGIAQPLITDAPIAPIGHAAGTGVVGKEIVEAGGHFEPALVAVALHGGNPAGVEHPAAQHLVEFPLEPVQPRSPMTGMVAKPKGRGLALQGFSCGAQAPLELVVVVGIEQIMLAVVLVVEHHLHLGQTPFESSAIRLGLNGFGTLGAIAPSAPLEKGLGQVTAVIPLAAIDQALQASPVGPGRRSVHPGAVPIDAGSSRQGIGMGGFIEGRYQGRGPVHPTHQLGKGITEQARDAQGDIHPRPAEKGDWNHLQIHQPPGGPIPDWAHPQEGQGLGNVFAAIAHGGGAPHRKGQGLEVFPLLLQMGFQQQFSAAPTQIPGRFGG